MTLTKARYEARPLPDPNPQRYYGVFCTFRQEFVFGESHPYPAVLRVVRTYNQSYEAVGLAQRELG